MKLYPLLCFHLIIYFSVNFLLNIIFFKCFIWDLHLFVIPHILYELKVDSTLLFKFFGVFYLIVSFLHTSSFYITDSKSYNIHKENIIWYNPYNHFFSIIPFFSSLLKEPISFLFNIFSLCDFSFYVCVNIDFI